MVRRAAVARSLGAQRRASRDPAPAEGRADAGGLRPSAAGRGVPSRRSPVQTGHQRNHRPRHPSRATPLARAHTTPTTATPTPVGIAWARRPSRTRAFPTDFSGGSSRKTDSSRSSGSAEVHELQSSDRPSRGSHSAFPVISTRQRAAGNGLGSWRRQLAGRRRAPTELDDYWIDRYEVTNAEFKRFVDQGGYETEKWWKEPFVKDGRALAWKDAMELFKDKTGQSGPATWSLGTFPEGEGDLPVSGVSWYEAAAFAAFADKELPSLHHWAYAAGFNVGVGPLLGRVAPEQSRREATAGDPKRWPHDVRRLRHGRQREGVGPERRGGEALRMGARSTNLCTCSGGSMRPPPSIVHRGTGSAAPSTPKPLAPGLLAEVRVPKPDYNRTPVGDKEFATYKRPLLHLRPHARTRRKDGGRAGRDERMAARDGELRRRLRRRAAARSPVPSEERRATVPDGALFPRRVGARDQGQQEHGHPLDPVPGPDREGGAVPGVHGHLRTAEAGGRLVRGITSTGRRR